ncbi:hypothetical protein D5085_13560 [Ectothiorhodospiraceae bacterium BW-2]|nr:hypothetical protein D5085_13560 [Ectothiorhodospiraceae bacterium BW-2]
MPAIADFNKNEMWIVNDTLKQRYGTEIDIQFAETEMRLDPHSTALTDCPTLFWSDSKGAHFVIVKVAEGRYRCQFFYRVHQQYGTGVPDYDDLTECVVTLLQVQADHEAMQREEQEGSAPSQTT